MLNSDLKVSIGMPVYNGEKFVHEAIESLLNQTFKNFELIISDNASIDRTGEVCRSYSMKDSRIIYVRQVENIGAAANFQFVLDKATGNFFMWAACDDLWSKDFLNNAINILHQNDDIGFYFPTFKLRSMMLLIYKIVSKDVFKYIESKDKKTRVVSFYNTHHLSHKCNIVYSVFKIHIIRSVMSRQSISNDGIVGLILLGMTRGKLADKPCFAKRYKWLWPGFGGTMLIRLEMLIRSNKPSSFSKLKSESFLLAASFYPEFTEYFEKIQISYQENYYLNNFKINQNIV